MSPILFAFLFMLGCILVPIIFMSIVGLIYWICGKDPYQSWWYKLLNPSTELSEEAKAKIEKDKARIREIEEQKAAHESRMKDWKDSQKVDRASCLTCTNRKHCDKTHCVGYSGDPSIK